MDRTSTDLVPTARRPDFPGASDAEETGWDPALPTGPVGLPIPAGTSRGDPAEFLEAHRDTVIVGLDWPVILAAAEAMRLGRHRDLLRLDHDYPVRRDGRWAEASFRVGRRQLSRLRSARDLRAVQRYLAAVEDGLAQGWNPVVFGIALAAFHLPYRQGLLHYAVTLMRGLARGCRPTGVVEPGWIAAMDRLEAPLPEAVRRLLPDPFAGPGTTRPPVPGR
ncbi:MAG: hypothetical protein FJ396_05265 [Verrucomicrobia bacterium]|nr:hypothetical protein [Verrucomicrobiota bacterium]